MVDLGEWRNTKSIIIENRHGIGDVLHMTWMIIYLRKLFPSANIDMIIPNNSYSEIFFSEKLINHFYYWENYNNGKDINKIIKLRENRYDLGFCAVNSTKHLAVALMKLIGCKRTIVEINRKGFIDKIPGVYCVYGNIRSNRVLRNVNLLSPIYSVEYRFDDFRKWESQCIYNDINVIKSNKNIAIFIGTNPNSVKVKGKNKYFDIKKWGYDKFFGLIEKIVNYGMTPIVLGGKKEYTESKKFVENLPEAISNKIINLCGKTTIKEMKEVFMKSTIVVACDTGPMHIAAALGRKVIAIFGPTNPYIYVIPDSKVTVVQKRMPCQYCHDTDEGFSCSHIECLRDISVDDVFNVLLEEYKEFRKE